MSTYLMDFSCLILPGTHIPRVYDCLDAQPMNTGENSI